MIDPPLAIVSGGFCIMLNKAPEYKVVIMTIKKPFSGKYLVGIRLELLISEEYDLACCWIISDSDSKN